MLRLLWEGVNQQMRGPEKRATARRPTAACEASMVPVGLSDIMPSEYQTQPVPSFANQLFARRNACALSF